MKLYAVIFAAVLIAGCKNSSEPRASAESQPSAPAAVKAPAAEYRKAPDFTLQSIAGSALSLSSYRGKIVIIDFWATWCGPCVSEIPGFIRLKSKYSPQGFEIIGISVDRDRSAVVNFAKEKKINYPIVFADSRVQSDYGGIRGIPTTFIIDRQGRIRDKVVGARGETFFDAKIAELMREDDKK